jgi:hypothetical protein
MVPVCKAGLDSLSTNVGTAGSPDPSFEQAAANQNNIKNKSKPFLVIILQMTSNIHKIKLLPLSRK